MLKTCFSKNHCNTLKMNTTECFKLITDIIYGYKSLFSAYFDKHIFDFLQYLENEPLNVLKLIVDIIFG